MYKVPDRQKDQVFKLECGDQIVEGNHCIPNLSFHYLYHFGFQMAESSFQSLNSESLLPIPLYRMKTTDTTSVKLKLLQICGKFW